MSLSTAKKVILFSGGGYAFSQSLGNELVTDGRFDNWISPTNATSWNESTAGTSTCNQETVDFNSSPFAARLDIDSSNSAASFGQTMSTVVLGDIVEISSYRKSNIAGKTSRVDLGLFTDSGFSLTTSYQQIYNLLVASSSSPLLFLTRGSAASSSLYFDDVSVKKITPNAQQIAVADGTIDVFFTLPVSPVARQTFHRWYRRASATPTLDGWDLYIRRNDANSAWDLLVDSVVSGTLTNRKTVLGVGTPTGLRVVTSGALHDHYTWDGATWTIRGSQVNNAVQQTSTIINTVYNTGFTPVSSVWA